MKTIFKTIIFLITTILLSSCSSFMAKPTETPTPTATSLPTLTPTPEPTATPTKIPTRTPTLAPTHDPSRYYAPDDFYSLVPPQGWSPADVGQDDPGLVGPKAGDINLALMFVRDQSDFDMYMYSAFFQDDLKKKIQNVDQISEDFLFTSDGLDYFRWVLTDTQNGVSYHQVFYFFGKDDQILIICFTRPDNQDSDYDSIVDEAIQTFRFDN